MRRAVFAGFAVLFSSSVALANGRFPATNAVVVQPGNPQTMALRATYGVLISKDAGTNWDWICEPAIGMGGVEDPSVVLTASGAIVIGTFNGLSRSSDGGCHWSHDVAWPASVVDLTTRPTSPNRIYAVTNTFSKMTDAAELLYASELFISDDAGAHWSSRTKLDPTLMIDSIEVAPNDSKRVYVSAVTETRGALLVSDDDGAHFKRREIKLIAQERGVYIAAVDPRNAARVYVRTANADASRLLVSDDAGISFREISHGASLKGFALADDGATIFAGDESGLLRASSEDDRFDRVSKIPIQCLTAVGKDLWACAPTGVGYVLGASSDRGATFSSKLTLAGMRELRCVSPSSMDVCAEDWSALESLVAPSPTMDASIAPTAREATATEKRSRFSCSTNRSSASESARFKVFFGIAIAFLLARRSRKRNAP
jgi:hypothetical protein